MQFASYKTRQLGVFNLLFHTCKLTINVTQLTTTHTKIHTAATASQNSRKTSRKFNNNELQFAFTKLSSSNSELESSEVS